MKLIIDNRETKAVEHFKEHDAIECEYQNLEIGDFQIGDLIIERKTIQDLSASIVDGRYREQKTRLKKYISANKDAQIIYIIEGKMKATNIPLNTLYSSLIGMVLRDKFYIIRSDSIDETITYLEKMYNRYCEFNSTMTDATEYENISKEEIAYCSALNLKKKDNVTQKVCFINQLAQIPSISVKTAAAIVDKYQTMLALVTAFNEEGETLIANIMIGKRKIGAKTSEKVYNYLIKCE